MMHKPEFGLSVVPNAADHARIIEQVLAAERGGLDLVGIQDHPYQRRYLETFSLIADLLARTERLRFFPDVANLAMRPPPMLGKAAVSLDVMSGGRFELGIGTGGFWQAVAGMGGPDRAPGERLAALEEAITLLRAVFDGERVVRGPGPHYPVPGYTVLNLEVDNIEAAVDRLLAAGVEMERYGAEYGQDERGITRNQYSPPIAWFKDPAGDILAVLARVPSA